MTPAELLCEAIHRSARFHLANGLKKTAILLTLVPVALALALPSARADSAGDGGALDPTFGTGGIASTLLSQLGYTDGDVTAVAVQPDGDVLVGGYLSTLYSADPGFALARYLPDGSLDPSFGNGAVVNTCVAQPINCGPNLSSGDGSLESILAEPDGKILAIGDGEHGLTFVRYNADGSLDTTFGTGGIIPDPNSPDYPPPVLTAGQAAALQPDGKILVLIGGATENGVLLGQGVARFNADGTPDQTFGTDGVVRVPTPPDQCSCFDDFTSLAQGPNGTIFIGGTQVYRSDPGTSSGSWLVAGFNSDGTPEAGFGSDGVAVTPGGGADAMAIQPDGGIVLAGQQDNPTSTSSAVLIRLTKDGTLDQSFGTNGFVVTADPDSTLGPALMNAHMVMVQTDGKIVAVGDWGERAGSEPASGFGLARFLPDGSPDTTFGIDGVAGVDFGSDYTATPRAALLQSDGKILAVGSGWPAEGTTPPPISWTAMRYLAEDSSPVDVQADGNGSGTVDSQPMGISCDGGLSCAAQFANNNTVTLTAHPASGAAVSWGGACSGGGLICKFTVSRAAHVDVTFSMISMCKTPRLHGKRLGRAEAALRDAQCAVGRVTRRPSRTVSRGSVISQHPGAGRKLPAGTRVNLVVSKGKRPR